MKTLPRMRTIKEVVQEMHKLDPKTAVREYYIRDLVNNNKIVFVRAGRKILVNFDAFLEYLQNPNNIDAEDSSMTSINLNKVRRIAE